MNQTPQEIHIEYWRLCDLLEAPVNPKDHDLPGIGSSIERFGYVDPVMVDERTGRLVRGHGRREQLLAMKEAGKSPPLRVKLDSDGEWLVPVTRGVWFNSDDEALAYSLADNRLTENGGWDEEALTGALNQLLANGGPEALEGTGFDPEDFEQLLEGDKSGSGSDGSLLSLTDVTIGDPKHVVEKGQVFTLGKKHTLVCAEVIDGWQAWVGLLNGDDVLFAPYPGPFVPLSLKAEGKRLVLVQPDPYIAGHILDRYCEIFGDDSVSA